MDWKAAAYYGSFLTGGFIVARLRASSARSVQDWLSGNFGTAGVTCYNLVIALRLLSEVFANLLVVGLMIWFHVERMIESWLLDIMPVWLQDLSIAV